MPGRCWHCLPSCRWGWGANEDGNNENNNGDVADNSTGDEDGGKNGGKNRQPRHRRRRDRAEAQARAEAVRRRVPTRSITRGVDFLLRRQNANGSWGSSSSTRPERNLCARAGGPSRLSRRRDGHVHFGVIGGGGDRPEAAMRCRPRRKWWLLEYLRRPPGDAPTRSTTTGSTPRDAALAKRMKRHAWRQRTARQNPAGELPTAGYAPPYECVDGGWAYYDFNAHTQTAQRLDDEFRHGGGARGVADTKDAGVDAPQRLIDRTKASILQQRKPDFSVRLRRIPQVPANAAGQPPAGSLGRSRHAIWPCGSGATRP